MMNYALVCKGRRFGLTAAAATAGVAKGVATRKRNKQHEETQQRALIEWVDALVGQVPALEMLFHVPNGGARPSKMRKGADGKMVRYSVEAAKLKAMGARAGVLDIFLDIARRAPEGTATGLWQDGGFHFHGLRLELKHGDGDLSAEQRVWRERWLRRGYAVHVCYSWVEAAHRIVDYLVPSGSSAPVTEVSEAQARILRRALPHAAQ
jgi:hypothetical protein